MERSDSSARDPVGHPVSAPKRAARKPKSTAREAWGILNPYGDVWTTDTFDTPEQATAYIANFWKDFRSATPDLNRFKVVKVRVRVTAIFPLQLADGPKGQDGRESGPGMTSNQPLPLY